MASIHEMVKHLLEEAIDQGASDIHLFPKSNSAIVQYRIGHQLYNKHQISNETYERLLIYFKLLAHMDIGEKRKPQNGSYMYQYKNQFIGLRFSTLPAYIQESLVIRILPHHSILPLKHLSIFPSYTRKLISLLKHSHGLILLSGPTGSGKTTTLYSLLGNGDEYISRKIISLEDPIEKETSNMLQIQVNERAGITYSTGLKAILRHDPDIIMVGEIRDAQTAKLAVEASLTGHLVISTIHSRDAKGAIYRLKDLGVNQVELEQTLVAIFNQRIVELTCPYCKELQCPSYCYQYNKQKRGTIFEMLAGNNLSLALKEAKGEYVQLNYSSLDRMIEKGISLGFIKPTEYGRVITYV